MITSVDACALPQELKGRFLIKGKRLNKLEASFADVTEEADNSDVTEEEESSNEADDEPEKKSNVRGPTLAMLVKRPFV